MASLREGSWCRSLSWPVAPLLAGLFAASGLPWTGLVLPSQAQLSPRCERNGKLDYCAVTPLPNKPDPDSVREVVVFADGDTYRLSRSDSACKVITPFQRGCEAIIQPASGGPFQARYVGTYYEGGYRHEYGGKNLKIVYYYMD